MTIELSVKDVRAALAREAGAAAIGEGEPATMLLGRIFHEVFAELVDVDADRSGLRVVAEAGPDREQRIARLCDHTWTRLLGPRLLRHAASLQASSPAVVATWNATRSLAEWLTDVTVELLESTRAWEDLGRTLRAEVPLACELREDGWTEPVRLVGIADSVLHARGAYCAIELKLGRAAPVVDLGQAALYHLILSRTQASSPSSALALLRFTPSIEEHVVDSGSLGDAEQRLVELIGTLAGVVQSASMVSPPRAEAALVSREPEQRYDELGKKLVRAYREQGVGIEVRGEPLVGPRFVRFNVRLGPGVRVDGVRKRTAEVQHRLELATEPLVVTEAGSLCVDLERRDPALVPFASIVDQLPRIDPLHGSAKALVGVDAGGRAHFADLASAGRSHMLVAGTSGSGKSEWLRTMLAALLASNTPDTLRVVTLDPKLAAFGDLEKSKFLWRKNAWWIPGSGRAASELFGDLIEEMEERYQATRKTGADHLAEHVARTGKAVPRILCVCDEYSALISQDRSEKQQIEQAVSLLGAKARAAGIHLVLATQQPSRATISGAIQTNLPCRVALYLASAIESNMILGMPGAERLTGSGDLLYKDFGDPVRLQAPLLSAKERSARLRG